MTLDLLPTRTQGGFETPGGHGVSDCEDLRPCAKWHSSGYDLLQEPVASLHPTLYSLHPSLCFHHPAPYTLHPTPYTLVLGLEYRFSVAHSVAQPLRHVRILFSSL